MSLKDLLNILNLTFTLQPGPGAAAGCGDKGRVKLRSSRQIHFRPECVETAAAEADTRDTRDWRNYCVPSCGLALV